MTKISEQSLAIPIFCYIFASFISMRKPFLFIFMIKKKPDYTDEEAKKLPMQSFSDI